MATLTQKKLARAVRFLQSAEAFLDGLAALQKARADMIADGMAFVDADFTGVTAHISAADLGLLESTIDALPAALTGHLTNITKIAGR